MVHTIAPAVRRSPTAKAWLFLATSYAVGSVLGGGFTGVTVGLIGALLKQVTHGRAIAFAIFLTVSVVSVLRDAIKPYTRLPGLSRQVPQRWRASLPLGYAVFLYGVQLGLGWATHVYFAVYYILLGYALVLGNAWGALALGASYGLGRAAVVFFFPNMTQEQVEDRFTGLGGLRKRAGLISAVFGTLLTVSLSAPRLY